MSELTGRLDALALHDDQQQPRMGITMALTRKGRRRLRWERAWSESKWRLYMQFFRFFSRWSGSCEQRGCRSACRDYEELCAAYRAYRAYETCEGERLNKSV